MSKVTGFHMSAKPESAGLGFVVQVSLEVPTQAECLALFTQLLAGGSAVVSGGGSHADRTGLVTIPTPTAPAAKEPAPAPAPTVAVTLAETIPGLAPALASAPAGVTHIAAPARRGRPPKAAAESPAATPPVAPAQAAPTPAAKPAPAPNGTPHPAFSAPKPSGVLRALFGGGMAKGDLMAFCLAHWKEMAAFRHLADETAVTDMVAKTMKFLEEGGLLDAPAGA